MTLRSRSRALAFGLLAMAALAAGGAQGCGGGGGGSSVTAVVTCGAGTELDGSVCTVNLDASVLCGPGTTFSGGVCVPVATDAMTDATDATIAVTCGAGTMLSGNQCVPSSPNTDAGASCGPGTMLSGGECVPDAASFCGPGTTFSNGTCVPSGDATVSCGPGTIANGSGECVPVSEGGVTCGPGTVLSGDMCVVAANDGGAEASPDAGSDANGCGCDAGSICTDGGCVACGGSEEPCCASDRCSAGFSCVGGFCACGQPGEPCCEPAGSCAAGSVCNESEMCACGGAGEVCCPPASMLPACSSTGLACTGPSTGAQGTCTCLVACNQLLVERSDNTLWTASFGAPTEMTSDGTNALLVQSFGAGYPGYNGPPTICAVTTAGNVVCQGTNGDGQLGYGSTSTATQSLPVEVIAGGSPLTGMTQVFVDDSAGALACAINAAGDAWCWGFNNVGQLGNGTTGNALSATPVMANGNINTPGGTQFTGVATMAVNIDHVCAVKKDGTVWCWGDNNLGQCGTGSAASQSYLNPQQVTTLGTNGVAVATGGANQGGAANFSCALTLDTGVWCWGDNSLGEVTPGQTDSNAHPTPVEVKATPEAGGPLMGITALAAENSNGPQVCVVQNAALAGYPNSLWCWGSNWTGVGQVKENGAAVAGVYLLCPQSNDHAFITSAGQFYSGASQYNVPSCP